jgi:hypothetical protein
MSRTAFVTLAALLLTGGGVRAQGWQIVLPGSTIEGDYLRGVGFAAAGLGAYERDSAVGRSIDTDTTIRWNEYVSAVSEYQSKKYARRREGILKEREQNYKAILQRIRENPEDRDVQSGDSLNDVMKQLLDPAINESSFRYAPVPLSADDIRRIPFKLDKENVVFSMHRLTATGKEKWPPALQDPKFALERRAYELALDTVLEQQIEGKMMIDAIRAVEAAVDDLFRKLDDVLTPSREKLYLEAKIRLTEFKKSSRQLLQSHRMEIVIGQLDRYSGTTVRDLLLFMQKNNLGFAGAESPEEKGLYPELYAALKLQQDRLKGATKKPER